MNYLLLGEDRTAKEQKIAEIKTLYLPSNDALKLDYELLDGPKCDPAELKKALIALPAISQKRVICIQSCEKFSEQNKTMMLDFAQTEQCHVVVILTTDSPSLKNKFLKSCSAVAEVFHFGPAKQKSNVFDMTRLMENRDLPGALKLFHQLLVDGNHPLAIMGGLVWFWGNLKNRLAGEHFKKGLLVLQEADLNIKRSRLKPEYAVEVAVTKLSSLIAC